MTTNKAMGPLVAVCSSLIVLLLAEGVCRILEEQGVGAFSIVHARGRTRRLYKYDRNLGWKNRPNHDAVLTYPHGKTRRIINEFGWRDRPYDLAKGDDVFRIAVLGGSFTFGYAVNAEDTYSKKLEQMLSEGTDRTVEVMNFGVNGYGLAQMLLNYQKNVRRYRPDLVLVQYGWFSAYRALYTDMWATQKPAFILDGGALVLKNHPVPKRRFRGLEGWLIARSGLFRFVKGRLLLGELSRKMEGRENVETDRAMHELSTALFKRFRAKAERNGAELAVFVWGEHTPWLKEICQKAKTRVFGLEEFADRELWEAGGELDYPPPVGHWTPHGHEFVATAIHNYLRREMPNLVGGLRTAP